jgi:hypothetical protein
MRLVPNGNIPAFLTIDVVGPMPIVILIALFSHIDATA